MDLMKIIQDNMYVVIVFGVVWVGTIVYAIVQRKHRAASNSVFLKAHPDAAKVYLATKALVTSEAALIHVVNGGTPEKFFDGAKTGFYLPPGQNSVEISYTYTRPGILYKNVSQSTGVVKKELVVEAYKNYYLGFDRKAEQFTFEELSEK